MLFLLSCLCKSTPLCGKLQAAALEINVDEAFKVQCVGVWVHVAMSV